MSQRQQITQHKKMPLKEHAPPVGIFMNVGLSVAVVTWEHGEVQGGLTAGWYSFVSARPPIIQVAISPKRESFKAIQESKKFSICTLSSDQKEIGQAFACGHSSKTNKFEKAGVTPFIGKYGLPLVPECTSAMECKLIGVHEYGDHSIFVGEVIHAYTGEKDPEKPLTCVGGRII
eukprot:gnl/Carplike_NY0171/1284_a1742_1285.p1 GENE.gnl/Carplike_NY0171/1284_a1742_1285~~gnl/Carplike_NY0171/1284_a1742_1285.p1  ORF type:complete len:175 (-),score=45.82 gnl/Carplike_NY0171/1284_a1742_1285:179-703(-)